MKLSGKTALVTGGAKRIGRALALGLAMAGCNVIVHYNTSAKAAAETVSGIKALGVKGWTHNADLGDEAAVNQLIPWVVHHAGKLDILVNNASIFPPEDFMSASSASWDANMMVNLKAPFLLSQAFAAALPANRPGKIINLLDSMALRPKNHHFSYMISKTGLAGLTQSTAYALAPHVQVNGIALGIMLPDVNDPDPDKFRKLGSQVPAGQPGTPADVVHAMLYLLQSDYVTGEIIRVDGGKHL